LSPPDPQDFEIVSFGPFRFNLGERALERAGVRVVLGSRAFDLLAALVQNAGDVVSTEALMGAAWPGLTVAPDNVRVQLGALRRALGDGKDRAKYIENVPARGYCFVAPVHPLTPAEQSAKVASIFDRGTLLPARLPRLTGRDADVANVSEQLRRTRFVTVVGPGGIGKTTLAMAVAHAMSAEFGGLVRFLDVSAISDPDLFPGALTSALGLDATSSDPIPGLLAALRGTRILIVLDSCEHLVEAVAALVERLFLETEGPYFLATSRETMQVQGETVYGLTGLQCPPDGEKIAAADAISFPAVRLFVDRVTASLGHFELTDVQAPAVARICRRLDGLALAIELAAGRVGTFGIEGIAEQLDDQFQLSWTGRRTSLTRHRTLRDTIDWSFNFLSPTEQAILRRLSITTGAFTLGTAKAVAASDGIAADDIVEAIGGFVTKSLVNVTFTDAAVQYRLLDTTQAYLREKLVEAGEMDATAERHALWFCNILRLADDNAVEVLRTHTLARQGDYLDNVRSALKWSFSSVEHQTLAIDLAGLAGPVFFERSLHGESTQWCARALASLDGESAGTSREVELMLCYGRSLMSTGGDYLVIRTIFERALGISEQLGRTDHIFMALVQLHTLVQRRGDTRRALELAERAHGLAGQIMQPGATVLAEWMLGLSHFMTGNMAKVVAYSESSRRPSSASEAINRIHSGGYQRIRTVCLLAFALWLQGYFDQARDLANAFFAEMAQQDDTANLIPLVWLAPIFIEFEERSIPEAMLARLHGISTRYSIKPYIAVASAWSGILRIRHGELEEGATELEAALVRLEVDRYDVLHGRFYSSLASAFGAMGQVDRGLTLIANTISRAEEIGEVLYLADMYRIQGDLYAASSPPEPVEAELSYARAVELAQVQGALLWELKAELGRTRFALRSGMAEAAVRRLAAVFGKFSEGFGSVDLAAAREIIDAHEPKR
jgi:predicted ATPase/DNA-binding winged helix-turn-helix (wHTH) protein